MKGSSPVARVTRVGSREELAFAAGLYEGEGSFSVCAPDRRYVRKDGTRSEYPQKAISIGMTDEEPLRRFMAVFGLPDRCLYGPYARRSPDGRLLKPRWDLRVQRFADIQAVLGALWPWLSPRRQSQIAAGFTRLHAYANGEAA